VRTALGIADEGYVLRVIANMGARDLSSGFRLLHNASDSGVDMRQLGRQVVSGLRDAMLIKSGCTDIIEGGAEWLDELRGAVADVPLERLAFAARRFAEITAREAAQPLLSLELAFVDSVLGATGQAAMGVAVPVSGAGKKAGEQPSQSQTRGGRSSSKAHAQPAAGHIPHPVTPPSSPEAAGRTEVASQGASTADEAIEPSVATPDHPAVAGPAPGDVLRIVSEADVSSADELEEAQTESEPLVEGELGRIRASWKEYVKSLRGLGSTGNLDAILRSACEPIALDDDVLVLRFLHEFHKSKIEDPKYRHVVEERLEGFYGRPFTVSCVLEASPNDAPDAPAAPVKRVSMVDAALGMGARLKNPR
jgi:DNA polymerase III subunit gamma/tau